MANGTLVRPFVRGRVTVFDETDFTLKASFAGSPSQVAPFRISTGIDNVLADVSAGVEVLDLRGRRSSCFMTGASATPSRRTLSAPRPPCRSDCPPMSALGH
jgi:hypothetical protein